MLGMTTNKKQQIVTHIVAIAILPQLCLATENPLPTKSGYEFEPGFAGPGSSAQQQAEDNEVKDPLMRFSQVDETLKPWFDWKAKLKKDFGITFGVAYTSLLQWTDTTLEENEDFGSSGIFRLTGRWRIFENAAGDGGELVAGFDQRHRYSVVPPADLGFEVGYLGLPGTLFNNLQGILGDLNYQQSFNGNNTGIIVGRYDPNDYFDVLGYANPWTSFQNIHILFNTTLALPDWSTGLGLGHWFNDQWYVKAGINDVNGTASETEFDFEFDELYKTAEIGWSPTRAERYFKNIHLTLWHADERQDGTENSQGVAIGANWSWDENLMLFTKMGWSDRTAPLYNKTITLGVMKRFARRSDLFGLAFNLGDPSDDNLKDQTTGEMFYRVQLAQNLAVTPSVQLFINPALNRDEDQIWLASLRIRLAL